MSVLKKSKLLQISILLLQVVAIPLTVYALKNAATYFARAKGTFANLVVDISGGIDKPSNFVWKNLAQGGEEVNEKTLSAVVGKIAALTPQYIRVDHVYDFWGVVKKPPSGNLVFSWERLDRLLSDITNTGAKPFIVLSYMPPAFSADSEVGLPASWNEWGELVQKTIEHVSGTNGLAISDVYYEVWNEPDLFGDFKLRGEKNYLELYRESALAAQRATGTLPFKIGGPATTALYKNWFDNFFRFVADNNLRVDFYSWHRYSEDLRDFEEDIQNAKAWIEFFPEFRNIEFIVSELGLDSNNNPAYDGKLSAIHSIATSAILEDNLKSSFIFEIKDGPSPQKYWGRWGILTHEKHGEPEEKPRYKAIDFMNRMMGSVIPVTGQGSWVKSFAKRIGSVTRLLVVNYDPQDSHYEQVPIKFINLPSQNFLFRRISFLGETKEERITTTSSEWQTLQTFSPNTAAIFEIVFQ